MNKAEMMKEIDIILNSINEIAEGMQDGDRITMDNLSSTISERHNMDHKVARGLISYVVMRSAPTLVIETGREGGIFKNGRRKAEGKKSARKVVETGSSLTDAINKGEIV